MGWVNPSRARRLIPCSVNDYMEARSTQIFRSSPPTLREKLTIFSKHKSDSIKWLNGLETRAEDPFLEALDVTSRYTNMPNSNVSNRSREGSMISLINH